MRTTKLDNQYPDLVEEAKPILTKCSRLSLAIVTSGGFMVNQHKTLKSMEKVE